MKQLTSHRLAELEKITKARELAAMATLSNLVARIRHVEQEILALQEVQYQPASVLEAEQMSKWNMWRSQELAKYNLKLARLNAEHRQASVVCGRVIAEQAVVARLKEDARKGELAMRGRRLTFLGGQYQ